MSRVCLYGGSFNPIHCGHLIVARAVAEHLALQRVVLLPSLQPPHKGDRQLAGAAHRAEMVRLAISGEPLFELSDFDLARPGPSYTIETVQHFRAALGAGTELFWLIGGDSLNDLITWHRAGELVDACRIVTAHRPGWDAVNWQALRSVLTDAQVDRLQNDVVPAPRIEISSTEIRRRIGEGRSIRYLVPDPVLEYIHRTGVYQSAASDRRA
jgi:nicotinate-nucleotide adenylyltransferase